MRQFYDITKKLKDTLEAHSQVNVVTTGDLFDVDLNKQTIFPIEPYCGESSNIRGTGSPYEREHRLYGYCR
jgi:hypothetical protein